MTAETTRFINGALPHLRAMRDVVFAGEPEATGTLARLIAQGEALLTQPDLCRQALRTLVDAVAYEEYGEYRESAADVSVVDAFTTAEKLLKLWTDAPDMTPDAPAATNIP